MRYRKTRGLPPAVRGKAKGLAFRFRYLVKRDGTNCHWCDRMLTSRTMTLDHVIPISKGGANCLNNFVLACQPCNRMRSNMDYEDFCVMAGRMPSRKVVNRLRVRTAFCHHCNEKPGMFRDHAQSKSRAKEAKYLKSSKREQYDIASIDYQQAWWYMLDNCHIALPEPKDQNDGYRHPPRPIGKEDLRVVSEVRQRVGHMVH